MGCGGERGNGRTMRAGSVLMEFLIVLPLYFALIGGIFAVGEILYKTIGLSVAGRLKALSPDRNAEAADLELCGMFPLTVYDDDERMMSVASTVLGKKARTLRTDEEFRGSWSWQSAARVSATHAVPPWSKGWIASAADFFDSATQSDQVGKKVLRVAGSVQAIFSDFLSLVAMERTERKYDSYVLARTQVGRNGFRSWKPKNMVHVPVDFGSLSLSDALPIWGAPWFKGVYREPFAVTSAEDLDTLTENQQTDEPPDQPGWRTDYARFPTFMLWSQ